MRSVFSHVGVALAGMLLAGNATAFAAPHEVRLPLHDGKVHPADLCTAVCKELHLPDWKVAGGEIDVTSLSGSQLIHAMNTALGDGCTLRIDRDALVLHVDPAVLPKDCDAAKRAVRVFTAQAAPLATAAQARHWGLFLPENLDPHQPLIVLIHGLDAEKECMAPMAEALATAGHQVALFGYPSDQPIDDSARFLGERLADLRKQYPALRVDIVAHSMGGLVARDLIESPGYGGGVDRLIMIGTPNAGSSWAYARFALEFVEQYRQWRQDPQYSCTWWITNGLGEAGRDLKPHSQFLEHLNSLPRRSDVKYTIIAGNISPTSRYCAEMADCTAHMVPARAQKWWGVRRCESKLAQCADHYRNNIGPGDGPVKLESARLKGVNDFVVLPADHAMLIFPDRGKPPIAWMVVEERLKGKE